MTNAAGEYGADILLSTFRAIAALEEDPKVTHALQHAVLTAGRRLAARRINVVADGVVIGTVPAQGHAKEQVAALFGRPVHYVEREGVFARPLDAWAWVIVPQ